MISALLREFSRSVVIIYWTYNNGRHQLEKKRCKILWAFTPNFLMDGTMMVGCVTLAGIMTDGFNKLTDCSANGCMLLAKGEWFESGECQSLWC